jgi:TonB family protein
MVKLLAAILVVTFQIAGCATSPPTCLEAAGATDSHRPPIYPTESRKLREEGEVMLRVFVNRLGYPSKVELRQSSGFGRLDEAALNAVRAWCFYPAKTAGEAVDAWVNVPIRFSLRREQLQSSPNHDEKN